MSVTVTGVVKNSPADRAHIQSGDVLLKVNGNEISDVLDYMYYTAEDIIRLVLKRDDKFIMLKLNKSEYDDLGLEFSSFLMDEKQSCSNKCVFSLLTRCPPE
ncbi:MAG: PDZ domain-containing protein [Oscillospiraceae bacterium]|nr:PDZ domain-containing protein [Oscillospiraceae bacterium]